jgi:ankyrin repeat protein
MPLDAEGRSPLHFSSAFGRLNATKILLDAIGNNSSYITQHAYEAANYYTPLHYAASRGRTSIVKLFLDRIAGDKNPKNKPGFKVIIHKSRGEQDS